MSDLVKYFFWVPVDLRDALHREARKRMIPTSALIRMILAEAIGYQPEEGDTHVSARRDKRQLDT